MGQPWGWSIGMGDIFLWDFPTENAALTFLPPPGMSHEKILELWDYDGGMCEFIPLRLDPDVIVPTFKFFKYQGPERPMSILPYCMFRCLLDEANKHLDIW